MLPSLFVICVIAFVSVMVILAGLALVIRLLTSVFPDRSPEADHGLVQAINKAVAQAYPGATVVRIDSETSEER